MNPFRRLFSLGKGLFLTLLILWSGASEATHIRGGEITARRVAQGSLAYEFTLIVYTDANSPVEDVNNDLWFGVGQDKQTSPRSIRRQLPGKDTYENIYFFSYTYPGPGSYTVYHYRQNRNSNVLNVNGGNSVNVNFYVESRLVIDPFIGLDRTPELLNPAVDLAALGQRFLHNPGAFDLDGDSLSYALVACRQFDAGLGTSTVVPNYQDAAVVGGGQDSARTGSAFIKIDPVVGTLEWDVPNRIGEYNVAFKITQWRRIGTLGRRDSIGYVVRDMQIIVVDARNERPYLIMPNDTCVIANQPIPATIRAIDEDIGQRVTITSISGLYTLPPPQTRAAFSSAPLQLPIASGQFFWQPNCNSVKDQYYDVLFKVEDNPSINPLVDIKIWRIKVSGPAPTGLDAEINNQSSGVNLRWDQYSCPNATRMRIFRKIGLDAAMPDTCNPGTPIGFEFINEVPISQLTAVDNFGGRRIPRGVNITYRLVATFPSPGNGLSLFSDTAMVMTNSDIPLMTKVDIRTSSTTQGVIDVEWTRPPQIDTLLHRPPFGYRLYKTSVSNPQPILVYSTNTLNDTTFTESNLNTKNEIYTYQVSITKEGGIATLPDSSLPASAVRLTATPQPSSILLSWTANVPWSNLGFYHYIYKEVAGEFIMLDSILTTSNNPNYVDDGSKEGIVLNDSTIYCYKVVAQGSYNMPNVRSPLLNQSQIACGTLLDTIPPCKPGPIKIENLVCGQCDSLNGLSEIYNTLSWNRYNNDTCRREPLRFEIRYGRHLGDPFEFLAETFDTFFVHRNNNSLAGCYQITAFDLSGNPSPSIEVCNDNCTEINLPNVITPNGDMLNEIFKPLCVTKSFLQTFDCQIYNRWGKQVYQTSNPEILWGPLQEKVAFKADAGIYYYIIQARFVKLRKQDEKQTIRGWIQVFKE